MKTLFVKKESKSAIKASRDFGKLDIKASTETPAGYGQLPLDILENDKEILIIAPLAGVDLEQAEVVINNDVLTVRGTREMNTELFDMSRKDYYLQECFWGDFSRSVILPPNAETEQIEATQSGHILYVRIPKRLNIQMRIVKIKSK